jgi:hypothetical protein
MGQPRRDREIKGSPMQFTANISGPVSQLECRSRKEQGADYGQERYPSADCMAAAEKVDCNPF